MLRVFSGDYCKCDVGIPYNFKDRYGADIELHTGDIVLLWSADYEGTDYETQTFHGMTVIVSDQYTCYSDCEVVENIDAVQPFVMGIKDVDLSNDSWRVELVKKYTDVVDGEHWRDYGFNYRDVELKHKDV